MIRDGKSTVLIVDDEEDILLTLKMLLKSKVNSVITESNPYHIPRLLRQHKPDLVLLDMNFRKGSTQSDEGLLWLQKIKEIDQNIQVIIITAHGDIELAVKALKYGAIDFIEKPWQNQKLIANVHSALKHSDSQKKIIQLQHSRQALHDEINQTSGEMIGKSSAMEDVFKTITKIAPTEANVLILGDNGTGKEMAARSIHNQSQRKNECFIKVDLGAISENLFESELFGHLKGSFTDAHEDRIGRFQAADGGTLFLDEIGNLNISTQAKLLSSIQNRCVIPVGSNEQLPINIRLICATNMPIQEMVKSKTFRQDLMYRINTVELKIPKLRDRIGDIPILTDHYLKIFCKKYKKEKLRISENGLKELNKHDWPGNVRELKHLIERAVILTENNILEPESFPFYEKNNGAFEDLDDSSLNIEKMERKLILKSLQLHQGSITKAAEDLGLTRAALYRRLEKFDLK